MFTEDQKKYIDERIEAALQIHRDRVSHLITQRFNAENLPELRHELNAVVQLAKSLVRVVELKAELERLELPK
jgi:hypothetical protein